MWFDLNQAVLHCLLLLQLCRPCFTLDGGLEGLLTAAHATAEQHLLEGLGASPTYPSLQSLSLAFRTPDGLEAFAALACEGLFPALRSLTLSRQFAELPKVTAISWAPAGAEQRAGILRDVVAQHEAALDEGECYEDEYGDIQERQFSSALRLGGPPSIEQLLDRDV
jgi:hypothetical protein